MMTMTRKIYLSFIIHYLIFSFEISCEASVSFTNNVTVWFDPIVRQYGPEVETSYTKEDLAVMVNVISKRFRNVLLGPAPELTELPPRPSVQSSVWIPQVVAEHNKKLSESNLKHEVIRVFVSAEFSRGVGTNSSSYDVAKHLATSANSIFPGTVSTLLFHTTDVTFFQQLYSPIPNQDMVTELSDSKHALGDSIRIGLQTVLRSCTKNLEEKEIQLSVEKILPHIHTLVLRVHLSQTKFGLKLDGDQVMRIFSTELIACEKKLKKVKKDLIVVPLVLCMDEYSNLDSTWLLDCWKGVTTWGEKNHREVYIYSAFDSPEGKFAPMTTGARVSGWWRLATPAVRTILKSSFVEKIQDKKSNPEMLQQSKSHVAEGSCTSQGEHFLMFSSDHETQAYVMLTLVSLICVLLIATDFGLCFVLFWRDKSGGNSSYRRGQSLTYSGIWSQ